MEDSVCSQLDNPFCAHTHMCKSVGHHFGYISDWRGFLFSFSWMSKFYFLLFGWHLFQIMTECYIFKITFNGFFFLLFARKISSTLTNYRPNKQTSTQTLRFLNFSPLKTCKSVKNRKLKDPDDSSMMRR